MTDLVRNVSDASFAADVLHSDRPVLVAFWAEWHRQCHLQAPTLEASAEKYCDEAVVARLNIDESPGVTERYEITQIPAVILFKHGKERARIVGGASKEAISRLIDKALSAASADPVTGSP